jgi:hypothetical protein
MVFGAKIAPFKCYEPKRKDMYLESPKFSVLKLHGLGKYEQLELFSE